MAWLGPRKTCIAFAAFMLCAASASARISLSAGWAAYNAEPHNPWLGSSRAVEVLDRWSPYSWELVAPQSTWSKGNAVVKRITLQAHSSSNPVGVYSRNYSTAEAVFRDQVQFITDRPELDGAVGTFRATIFCQGAFATREDPLNPPPQNVPTIVTWQASAALGQRFSEMTGSALGDGSVSGSPISGAFVLDIPFTFNGDEETFSFHAALFARSTTDVNASAQSLANVDLSAVWGGAQIFGPDGSVLTPGADFEARFAGFVNNIGDGSFTWLTALPEPTAGITLICALLLLASRSRHINTSLSSV